MALNSRSSKKFAVSVDQLFEMATWFELIEMDEE